MWGSLGPAQYCPWDLSVGSWVSSTPPPGVWPAEPQGGRGITAWWTRAFRVPPGPLSSGQCWVQRAVCVCVYMYVCACTHLSHVCSERDLSTSHEKQGLCPPSAHSYPGSGAPGRLLPGLPAAAPARGASVTARDSRRRVGCGSMKAAPVPCGEMVGARLDAEVEGPQPQARAGGSPVPGSQQVCSCADLGPLTLSPRECTVPQGPCLARNVSSSSQATPASSGLCVALFPPCLHLCVVCAS